MLAAAAATGVALGLWLSGGSNASRGPGRWQHYTSQRHSFAVSIPPGWRRAEARLVPRLLMPREILALGTAAMPVGGGGNCGREPVAAARRLGPGDALLTVQEYEVTARMRRHLRQSFPSLPRDGRRIDRLLGDLHRTALATTTGSAPSSATLSFSARGRAFDALVYFNGRSPGARLRRTVAAILASLRFDRGVSRAVLSPPPRA